MRFFFTCFSLLLTSGVTAQDRSARLDYSSNVEGCMSADRFSDEVSARLGRQGFTTTSDDSLRVRVYADEGQVVAAVEMGGEARLFRDVQCSEALEAAAAAVAVWLDEPVERVFGALTGQEQPAIPEPVVAAADNRARLRVSSNWPDLTLHIETNTGVGSSASARFFERLCLMPCETRVRRGLHQFGIAVKNGIASPLPELTEIQHDTELFINVRRASAVNQVGRWLIAVALILVAPVGIPTTGLKRDDWGDGPFFGTIIASSAMVLAGTLMISFGDGGGTELELRPY